MKKISLIIAIISLCSLQAKAGDFPRYPVNAKSAASVLAAAKKTKSTKEENGNLSTDNLVKIEPQTAPAKEGE